MRTTITLDPEAVALIEKEMKQRKLSFKQAVNEAIVRGLAPAKRVTVDLPTHDYGRSLVNLDKAMQLAGQLEDEEILRKMSLGK